ncbi:MAG: hypothetical protein RIR26_1326 [Pseudomonadota bacterium]
MSQSEERKNSETEREYVRSLSEFNTLHHEISAEQGRELSLVGEGIKQQLEQSRRRFFLVYGIASVVGYFLSLSVCSQNSIALTSFSVDIASSLHQLPDPWCPLVCGWVFSLIPSACLLLSLDRFQRRRLVSQFWWLPPLTTIGFCVLMTLLPSYLQHEGMHVHHVGMRTTHTDILWLMWWLLASVSIPAVASAWARSRIRAVARLN